MLDFYNINTDILFSLKEEFKNKVKLINKNNYQKLIYHNHMACDIVILSLPKELKIDAGGSNLFCSSFINNCYTYITKEEFMSFNRKKVQEYIKRTYDFLYNLIKYAEGLATVFEHYSWCYDYERIICDFIRQNPTDILDINDSIEVMNKALGGGTYWLNAFVAYPATYHQKSFLIKHTRLLKKLTEIYPLEREKVSLIPSHIRKDFREYRTGYRL